MQGCSCSSRGGRDGRWAGSAQLCAIACGSQLAVAHTHASTYPALPSPHLEVGSQRGGAGLREAHKHEVWRPAPQRQREEAADHAGGVGQLEAGAGQGAAQAPIPVGGQVGQGSAQPHSEHQVQRKQEQGCDERQQLRRRQPEEDGQQQQREDGVVKETAHSSCQED